MATKEMPLLLDNGIPMQMDGVGDVDDLFGDATGLPTMRQPSKQIDLRLDQLRNRGSFKTMAWSKVGTIASITPDGQELELRFLRCQPSDGEWGLSEPTVCSQVRGTPEDPLVHLEWSETNNPELAVFDSAGRLTLLLFSHALNQPFVIKRWDTETIDDSQAVVGSYWLPANLSTTGIGEKATRQSYNVLFGPATKSERPGYPYSYASSFVHAESPAHPQTGRSALLTVTTGGLLKMVYMQVNNRPEETRLELENIGSADDLITHAAFTSEKKYLVLALVTTARRLQFVRIDIQWGVQPGRGGSQDTRFNASLIPKLCAVTSLADDSPEQIATPEVTGLLVLPSVLDKSGKETVPPMIISARTRTTSPASFQASAAQTVISRWEACEQKHNLQSAVMQLGTRRNSVTSEPPSALNLRPLEPVLIDKCVVGMQSTLFGKIVILMFSDGSIQHRDRFTFEELYTERDFASVMHLRQAGFSFPDDTQCQQMALSPSGCSLLQLGDNGKMTWSKLRLPDGDIGNSLRDEHYGATIAGLVVAAATSIKYQTNFDDILAIAQPLASKPKFVQDFVGEIIRVLAIQVDYVVEPSHDALLKNTQLPSCIAMLISLGFRGDMRPRSFQSTYGQIAASIRHVAFNLTVATSAQFNVAGRKSPMDDSEVVEVLASQVKWGLDLVAWITDSLFELMNDDEFMSRLTAERSAEVSGYLEKRGDVALHLMLCSSSRCFLTALCRRLTHMDSLANKAMLFYRRHSATAAGNGSHSAQPEMQRAFHRVQQVSASALVRVTEFEKLVGLLGAGLSKAYGAYIVKMVRGQPGAPAQDSKEEEDAVKASRARLEMQMLVATGPPPGLWPVLHRFFTADLVAFRKATEPARLFFEPLSVMTAQDGGYWGQDGQQHVETVDGMRTTQIDVFTKNKIRMGPGRQWKRCTRCTSVMEEMQGKGAGLTFLLAQQRRCPCNGTLAVLPTGKLDFSG